MKRMLRNQRKRATVVVEMAFVIPILLTILFGGIEFGWQMSARNAMTDAAREAARKGALPGATTTDITNKAKSYLSPYKLDSRCTIAITMATTTNPNVTVVVSVPQASISLIGNYFHFTSGTISTTGVARKEGS